MSDENQIIISPLRLSQLVGDLFLKINAYEEMIGNLKEENNKLKEENDKLKANGN